MRKFLSSISTNVVEIPLASPSTPAPALAPSSLISFPPSLSPVPLPLARHHPFILFPSIDVGENAFDLATLLLIACLIIFCVLSFSIIFHLCLRSRRWHHLQHFNSFWTTRILLVSFATLWALNEVLRLPIFRRRYLLTFLPPISLNQQANLCKVHQVLSLGFFEPGFLVTLLFLVNVSIMKGLPRRMWALASICLVCSPVLALQTIFVFFSPLDTRLPNIMHESSLRYTDTRGNAVMLCKDHMLSTLIFGAFAGGYLLAFLISSWKVVAFVINKNIRARINNLALTVMIALPLQVLCLVLSALWTPDEPAYSCTVLAAFLCVAWFIVIGEVILVITPINEALAAGRCACGPWRPNIISRRSEVEL